MNSQMFILSLLKIPFILRQSSFSTSLVHSLVKALGCQAPVPFQSLVQKVIDQIDSQDDTVISFPKTFFSGYSTRFVNRSGFELFGSGRTNYIFGYSACIIFITDKKSIFCVNQTLLCCCLLKLAESLNGFKTFIKVRWCSIPLSPLFSWSTAGYSPEFIIFF